LPFIDLRREDGPWSPSFSDPDSNRERIPQKKALASRNFGVIVEALQDSGKKEEVLKKCQ